MRLLLSTGLTLALLVCSCASWFPGKVSKGVARLSVRNVGAILKIIQEDTRCGFSSGLQPQVVGAVGDTGWATWRVSDCEIEFDHELLETNCLGEDLEVHGGLRVTATKTVRGWVTGDSDAPIVPQSEDAVEIEFSAEVDGFVVKSSAGPESLRMKSGVVSVLAKPRLALEAGTASCAVATPDVRFEEIVYERAKLYLSSPDNSFDVDVPRSSFGAQSGQGLDASENHMWGKITVWDDNMSVEGLDLDPDYESERYRNSYTCMEDYVLPISRDCSIDAKLGRGAARLLIRNFGVLSKVLDEDEDCGFARDSGIPDKVDGIPFLDDVTATWKARDCQLGGAEAQMVERDCLGTETHLSGTVLASATKEVRGELGASMPPILPKGRRDAIVEVDNLSLVDLEIREEGEGASDAYLVIEEGTLRGLVLPVTGEAASDRGSYYIKTPVAEFAEVVIENATVLLHSEGRSFRFHIAEGMLSAFNGSYRAHTNWISGSLDVNGALVEIEGALDEEYVQEEFDASYVCEENLLEVVPAGQ
jgi:hypothetical protein